MSNAADEEFKPLDDQKLKKLVYGYVQEYLDKLAEEAQELTEEQKEQLQNEINQKQEQESDYVIVQNEEIANKDYDFHFSDIPYVPETDQ